MNDSEIEDIMTRKLKIYYTTSPCFNCGTKFKVTEGKFNDKIQCPECKRIYFPKEVEW